MLPQNQASLSHATCEYPNPFLVSEKHVCFLFICLTGLLFSVDLKLQASLNGVISSHVFLVFYNMVVKVL